MDIIGITGNPVADIFIFIGFVILGVVIMLIYRHYDKKDTEQQVEKEMAKM
jgi:predicted negative regulator of RcsB-dependent stress response